MTDDASTRDELEGDLELQEEDTEGVKGGVGLTPPPGSSQPSGAAPTGPSGMPGSKKGAGPEPFSGHS